MNNLTLIVGTGGFSKQLLSYSSPLLYPIEPIYFNDKEINKEYFRFKVINDEKDIPKECRYFIIAVSNPKKREFLTYKFAKLGLKEKNIWDKKVEYLDTEIEDNTIILGGGLIEPNVTIKYGSIINTNCNLHHDVKIGKYVTLSPNVTLLGNVEVGDYSFIGAGTIIKEKTKIGKNCIIGMGSIVLNDIPDNILAYGNPCITAGHRD